MKKALLSVLAMLAGVIFGGHATASDRTLTVSTSSNGTTLVTLAGPGSTCYNLNNTSAVVFSGSIAVTSLVQFQACFPTSPPSSYSITVDLGFLPSGHYSVSWAFGPPLVDTIFSTEFDVMATAASAPPYITLGQDPLGHVIAQLSGVTPSCQTLDPGFVSGFSAGQYISVLSEIHSGCTGEGPFLFVPYSISADLGVLADGDYRLSWGAVNGFGPIGGSEVQTLAIRNGLLVVVTGPPYNAQIIPNPSYAGQSLVFTGLLPGGTCYDKVDIQQIEVSGTEVTVSYTISPIPPMPFCLSPPLSLGAQIGAFAPGNYTARAFGDYHGTTLPPLVVPFSVLAAPSPLVSYQGLWWNAPAGSEAGWGLNLAHQGDLIFATWFTYDLTGKAWWLVMTAEKTANSTYAGKLYQATGPAFDSVPFPPIGSSGGAIGSVVGYATLTFSDSNNGTFAYTVNGISQTKSITRQVFGTLPTCVFEPERPTRGLGNMTDLWWAAPPGSEAGWGISISDQLSALFATWFTYDRDNTPMWLVVTATQDNSTGKIIGDLYRTTGPPFNAVPFPPIGSTGGATGTIVGSAAFTFYDDNSATFTYTLEGVTQSKTLTREIFASPGAICR